MKSERTPLVEPWTATTAFGSREEQEAARLLGRAVRPEPVVHAQLSLIRLRVRHTLGAPERSVRPLGLRRAVAMVASVGAVLLLGSGLVTAAFWGHLWGRPSSPTSAPSQRARVSAARTPWAAADMPPPTLAPPPVASPSHSPVAAPAPGLPAPLLPVRTAVAVSPAAAEVALFTAGLQQLRRNRDREAAIATFHDYARRFPAGLFRDENRASLVEALVETHRTAEALALLETEPPAAGERGRVDRVLRGELRARLERCPAAIEDFDGVLTPMHADTDAAAERALFGRAVCRARLGETEAARADLATYVRRFPEGRFGAEARRLLAP